MTDREHELLRKKYPCIGRDVLMCQHHGTRMYNSIRDDEGRVYGWDTKLVPWERSDKKTLHYYTDERRVGAWFNSTTSRELPVVIVEDVLSARIVNDILSCTAVSLMGTHLPEQIVDKLRGKRVAWALDGDAYRKAVEMHNKCKRYLKDSEAIRLTQDLKCFTQEELIEWGHLHVT
jgi:hypothetical protein